MDLYVLDDEEDLVSEQRTTNENLEDTIETENENAESTTTTELSIDVTNQQKTIALRSYIAGLYTYITLLLCII